MAWNFYKYIQKYELSIRDRLELNNLHAAAYSYKSVPWPQHIRISATKNQPGSFSTREVGGWPSAKETSHQKKVKQKLGEKSQPWVQWYSLYKSAEKYRK
jgi:hypothetical protein